jgi:hypothetical protein
MPRSMKSRHHRSRTYQEPTSSHVSLENRGSIPRLTYTKPGGYTCAAEGKQFPTVKKIRAHDDKVHGSARVTWLPGKWEDVSEEGWNAERARRQR